MQGLKYISWGDTTGYAIAAKTYLRGLITAGVDLTWTPMLPGPRHYELQPTLSWPDAPLASVCNRPLDYDTVLIHTVPEYFPPLIEQERRKGRRIFGYTVWELDRLPVHWADILNRLHGVLVPCRWNVEVFRRSGVTVPIHVVPHLSQFEDMTAAGEYARSSLRARVSQIEDVEDRFVCYTIGYWSNRKAPYLALQAYLRAFDAGDPVLMIVKTSRNDITRWHRHWRNRFRRRHPSPVDTIARMTEGLARPAPVVALADETLSDEEMLALHEMGDCFVSLARAEGWGLGAFEAARLGKPVVSTGYGGQLDYLDARHSRLVDYEMVPVHEPTWSANYQPGDLWAEPSVPQAAAHLRAIFENQAQAQACARRQAERLEAEFSRPAVIAAMLRALA